MAYSNVTRRVGRRCLVSRLNSVVAVAAPLVWQRGYEDGALAAAAPKYDVFINHRGVDTKKTVARLLYDRLVQGHGVRAFLDSMSMKPGDRLVERINEGIHGCGLAVTIFSPRYVDSEFCLRELSMLVEAQKKIIPIFCDIKPSELRLPQAVLDSHSHLPAEIEKFKIALHEAKHTVGLTFDSNNGDMAELVSTTTDILLENLQRIRGDVKHVSHRAEISRM